MFYELVTCNCARAYFFKLCDDMIQYCDKADRKKLLLNGIRMAEVCCDAVKAMCKEEIIRYLNQYISLQMSWANIIEHRISFAFRTRLHWTPMRF